MKKNNVLRDLITAGKPTISTHVFSQWPGVVELVGFSGTMDYIEFSGQYAPYDLFSLENFGRAIDLFDHMTAMMKLDQEPRTYLAERAIGSGIQNMLFADVRTVEDTRESVNAVRMEVPGGGLAGAKSTRNVGYGEMPLVDAVKDADEAIVAIMIEKKGAVEDLEEILSVPGVDMVQFGPGDYSMSIGHVDNSGHPDVKKAEKYTIETCIKMGVRPRAEISNWEQAKPYMDMGVIDFCMGSDIASMRDFCTDQGEALAKLVGR